MKTIYIFGNPLLDFDNLPIKLAPDLREEFPELEFEVVDPNENMHPTDGVLIIIDTVINIDEPVLIDDIDDLELSPRYSMHDLDLAFNLKLLKKIGKLDKAFIIGLPPAIDQALALQETIRIIRKIKVSL